MAFFFFLLIRPLKGTVDNDVFNHENDENPNRDDVDDEDDDDDDYGAVVLTDQGHTFHPPAGFKNEGSFSSFPGRDDNEVVGRYGNTRPRGDYYRDDDDDEDDGDVGTSSAAINASRQYLIINVVIPIVILIFVVFVIAAAWLWKR